MSGFIAYLVTPLSRDGSQVRADLFEPYLDGLLAECRLTAVACLANDFAYLTAEERRRAASDAVRKARGRVPVYVCTSAISTAEAIELSKHAADQGAAKVIVNPQNYSRLSEDQILRHYVAIARAIAIPIHIYNNPVTTNINMSVSLLRRIVDETGAHSIKEAGSPVEKFQDLQAEFGSKVALHVGFHYMALGGFALGANAWDVGLVRPIAAACYRLFRAAVVDRDLPVAQELFAKLLPLFVFFQERGPLPSLKALAAFDGLDLGGTRAPIEGIDEKSSDDLRNRLRYVLELEGAT